MCSSISRGIPPLLRYGSFGSSTVYMYCIEGLLIVRCLCSELVYFYRRERFLNLVDWYVETTILFDFIMSEIQPVLVNYCSKLVFLTSTFCLFYWMNGFYVLICLCHKNLIKTTNFENKNHEFSYFSPDL